MKWIESINVRFSAGKTGDAVEEIFRSVLKSPLQNGVKDIKLYRNASLATDLSLSIHWEKRVVSRQRSALGMQVADALREFSLVHHAVWVEEASALDSHFHSGVNPSDPSYSPTRGCCTQ